MLLPWFLDFFSVGVGNFVLGLSQISFFFYKCVIRERSNLFAALSNLIREL